MLLGANSGRAGLVEQRRQRRIDLGRAKVVAQCSERGGAGALVGDGENGAQFVVQCAHAVCSFVRCGAGVRQRLLARAAPDSLAGEPAGLHPALARMGPRRRSVNRAEYWPAQQGAMGETTRNPWLLFLLFGLFLLRAPQCFAGSSMQPAACGHLRAAHRRRHAAPTSLWRGIALGAPRAQQPPNMPD